MNEPMHDIQILAAAPVSPRVYRAALAHAQKVTTIPGPYEVRVSPFVKPGDVLLFNLSAAEAPDA